MFVERASLSHQTRSCDYQRVGLASTMWHVHTTCSYSLLGIKSLLALSFLRFECLIVPPKNRRLVLVEYTEAKLAVYTEIEYPSKTILRL